MLSRALLAAEDHTHAAHAPRGFAERFNHGRERLLDWLRDTYGLVLTVAMRHRPFVIVVLIAVGAASGLLLNVVGTDFFPTPDVGIMKLHFRAPLGTRIEETEKIVLRVEEEIRKVIPADQIDRDPGPDRRAAVLQSVAGADRQHQRHGRRDPDTPEEAAPAGRRVHARDPRQDRRRSSPAPASTSRTPTSSPRCSTSACRRPSTSRCRTPTSSAPRSTPRW